MYAISTLDRNDTNIDLLIEKIRRSILDLARALEPIIASPSFSVAAPASPKERTLGTLSTLSPPVDLSATQLDHLMSLWTLTQSASWRQEGGEAIPEDVWVYAGSIVAASTYWACPDPFVSVSEDGYLHFAWTNDGGDRVVLEISAEDWWLSYIGLQSPGDDVEALQIGGLGDVQRYISRWL